MNQSIHNFSFLKDLRIQPAGLPDYHRLSEYHYCPSGTGPLSHLFKLVDTHPRRHISAPVVGIIVYGPPPANLAVRNTATNGIFTGLPRSEGLSILNRHLRCIRRVIIEPRYRGLGLASQLVRQTLRRVEAPMVEVLSIMGRVHPFFERAGMTPFEPSPDAKTERLAAAFEAVGLTCRHDSAALHRAIETLPPPKRDWIVSQMDAFITKFGSKQHLPHGPERTAFVLAKLTARPLYYLWVRPDWPLQTPAPAVQ